MQNVLGNLYGGVNVFREKHPTLKNTVFYQSVKKVRISGNLDFDIRQLNRIIRRYKRGQTVRRTGKSAYTPVPKKQIQRILVRKGSKVKVLSPVNSNSNSSINSITRALSRLR